MSRKKSKNRKFLEEQVQKMFEQDSDVPIRGLTGWGMRKSQQDSTIDDTSWTDKQRMDYITSGGKAMSAYHAAPAAKQLKTVQQAEDRSMSDEMYELLMTIFFGMKNSRDSVIQAVADQFNYGSIHDLSNIHKALDQVDGLTPFEAFAFRFYELDFKPTAVEPTSNMRMKSEIFQKTEMLVNSYASKIYSPFRHSGLNEKNEAKIRSLYGQFMKKAYKEVFEEYLLSDDVDSVLSSPLLFGGINPDKGIASKITREPTEEYIKDGADKLISAMKRDGFRHPEFEDLEIDITRQEVAAYLEKKLVHLSTVMSRGHMNPTGRSIDSFEDMRTAISMAGDESENPVNPDRILAAIAIREDSRANKRFTNMLISFADVILSVVGTASMIAGAPGFLNWLRTMSMRGLGFFGLRSAKEFLNIAKKVYKPGRPGTFVLGMTEFLAGLGLAFAQNIRDVENRFYRVEGFHHQYFALLAQYMAAADAKSYKYLKSDVGSYAYTKDQLGKVVDSFKSLVFPDDKADQDGPLLPEPPTAEDFQVVARDDFSKTLDNILSSPKESTMDSDIDSQLQDLDSISPLTGSSIMQCWRDIYTLIIELQMSAALYSVKSGADRERIRSRILNDADQSVQKEYEIFMDRVYNLYKEAHKIAIQAKNPAAENAEQFNNKIIQEVESKKREIEAILDQFKEVIAMFKRQKELLEKETKKAKPYLIRAKAKALTQQNKEKKQQESNEYNQSVLKEQTNPNETENPSETEEKGEKEEKEGEPKKEKTRDQLKTREEYFEMNKRDFEADAAGHKITPIDKPKKAGSRTKKDKWVKLEHKEFKQPLVLSEYTAYAFVQLRKDWPPKYRPLLPSSVFREKSNTSLGNHENGIALDLITPKQTTNKGKMAKINFLHYVIERGWLAGFRGFGFPTKTPCDNGDKCHTHIDTKWQSPKGRFWFYSKKGRVVRGQDIWIYKNHDDWFVTNILKYERHNFSRQLMPAMGLAARHERALKDYEKEESTMDGLSRLLMDTLKELGLDDPGKLMSVFIDELIKRFEGANKEFESESKKFINSMGDATSEAGKFLARQVEKGKLVNIDAVADRKYFQKNYASSIEKIEKIENIQQLITRYTAEYGVDRTNVGGRVGTIRNYAAMLNDPGELDKHFRNKNKEFEYNILNRFKAKKRAANRFKQIPESIIYEQSDLLNKTFDPVSPAKIKEFKQRLLKLRFTEKEAQKFIEFESIGIKGTKEEILERKITALEKFANTPINKMPQAMKVTPGAEVRFMQNNKVWKGQVGDPDAPVWVKITVPGWGTDNPIYPSSPTNLGVNGSIVLWRKLVEIYNSPKGQNTKVRDEVPKLKPSQKKSQKKPNHGRLDRILLTPSRDPKKDEAIIKLYFDDIYNDSKPPFNKETDFDSLKTSDENVIGFKIKGVKLNQVKQLNLPKDKDIEYVVAKPGERSASESDVDTIEVYIKFRNAKAKDVAGSVKLKEFTIVSRITGETKTLEIQIPRRAMATDSSGSSSAEAVTADTSKVLTLFGQLPKNVNLVGKPAMAVAIGQNADKTPKYMAVKITKEDISLNEKSFQFIKHTKLVDVPCNIDEAKVIDNKMKITLSFIGVDGTVTLTEEQVMNVFSIATSIPRVGQSSKELNFGDKDKGSIKWHKIDQGFQIPDGFEIDQNTNSIKKKAEVEKTKKTNATPQAPEFDLNIEFKYFLKDGKTMPSDQDLRQGRGTIADKNPAKVLKATITKMLNDWNSNEFNQYDYFNAEYVDGSGGNLVLTKPQKPNEPITVLVKFKVKAEASFVKQVKDSEVDFNSEELQDELNNYIGQKIGNQKINDMARKALRNTLFRPFVDQLDGTANNFNSKPQISKTEWNFENSSVQTALARGSEDSQDPYEVSDFNKRKRLIEYIPTNFLKFSNEEIFTVTFDLPGNGFDEFLTVNPTVVRGRDPFNKSAPGEREADRNVLLAMLKRNKQIFVKFLDKLEQLAQIIGDDGRMVRIEYGKYTRAQYKIYKDYFESYIYLFENAISSIENSGDSDFDSILRRSYSVNLLSAVIYNLR